METQLAGGDRCACRYNVANLAPPPSSSSFSPRFRKGERESEGDELRGPAAALAGTLSVSVRLRRDKYVANIQMRNSDAEFFINHIIFPFSV